MDEFEQALIRIIEKNHPETLAKAVNLARSDSAVWEADKRIGDSVLRLESQVKILLKKPAAVFFLR